MCLTSLPQNVVMEVLVPLENNQNKTNILLWVAVSHRYPVFHYIVGGRTLCAQRLLSVMALREILT